MTMDKKEQYLPESQNSTDCYQKIEREALKDRIGGWVGMTSKELLEKALDFIVETQKSNDYICEQMVEESVGDYCYNNCQNLNKECVKLFLEKVYNKS